MGVWTSKKIDSRGRVFQRDRKEGGMINEISWTRMGFKDEVTAFLILLGKATKRGHKPAPSSSGAAEK